jgi:hypothetical protein
VIGVMLCDCGKINSHSLAYVGHVATKDGDIRRHFDEFLSWKKQSPVDVRGLARSVFSFVERSSRAAPFFAMVNLFDAHRNVDGMFVSEDDQYYEIPDPLDRVECLVQLRASGSTLHRYMSFMGPDYLNSTGSELAMDVVCIFVFVDNNSKTTNVKGGVVVCSVIISIRWCD